METDFTSGQLFSDYFPIEQVFCTWSSKTMETWIIIAQLSCTPCTGWQFHWINTASVEMEPAIFAGRRSRLCNTSMW